jgi:polyphosphate kinase 2
MAAKRTGEGRSAKAARKGAKAAAPAAGEKREKMKNKEYEEHVRKLHGELVKLQLWVQQEGLRIVVVFEGRDTAGKGGVIKAITERVSPRVFRIVALPAPTEREKSQLYVQRYLTHFPAAGEVILFDRSWYNRAGVERVMGFCSEEEAKRFLQLCPLFERGAVNSGIVLIKYWLEVTEEEQQRRFESRINDPRKIWKLSPMDVKAHGRWYDYSRARDDMLAATDTPYAPWYIVDSNDQRRARLNCISHLLSLIPYKEIKRDKIKLPKRQKRKGYEEPRNRSYKHIPQVY